MNKKGFLSILFVFLLALSVGAQEESFYGEARLWSRASWYSYPDWLAALSAGSDQPVRGAAGGLRLKGNHTLSYDWGEVSLRHQVDLVGEALGISSASWGGDLSGSSSAALQDVEYRLFQASVTYWAGDALTLRAGRHTLAWGMGYAFFPGDKLHPERTPEGDYAGFDGISGTVILSPDWTATAALRMDGFFGDEENWWEEARGALLISGYFAGIDAMAGCVAQYQEVLRPGLGFSADLSGLILTLEGAAEFLPNQDVLYPKDEGGGTVGLVKRPLWQPLFSAALGAEHTFYLGDHTLTLLAEYYFDQEGLTGAEGDLFFGEAATLSAYNAEVGADQLAASLPSLGGQHYLFPRIAWDWDGRFSTEHTGLINLQDRSALISHSAGWAGGEAWEVKLSGSWVYGDDETTELGMIPEKAALSAWIALHF